jgi:hypothetical protein
MIRYVALGSNEMRFQVTQRLWLTTLLAILVTNSGCSALMHLSSSSFLSKFSLEDLVKSNRSPYGRACANGGMGGAGVGASSIGRRQSSSYKSSSFSCQIDAAGENTFDGTAFIASLKADVEKEINDSGAKVINQGSSDPAGFYFEYRDGAVRGRIDISGKKSGANYYSLQASLDEKRETESK